MLALLLTLAAAPAASQAYPSLATDAGYAQDAGDHGEVIDNSSLDAGTQGTLSITRRVALHIEGARVLTPEIYFDVVRLSERARPDAATAKEVQRQIIEFLLRTGFELATVVTSVAKDGIDVEINEGQIERVLFLGQLSFQQLRFKLALLVPADVFNRPQLDRQVRELSESMKMPGVRWELVRTSEVEHTGPQVEQLPAAVDLAFMGGQLIHERRPYELHIIFPDSTGSGLGIDIRSGYLNGIEGGVNFLKRDFLFAGDRAWGAASGGGALRARLDTEKLYVHFSRAAVELRYDLFPLLGRLRPELWTQGEWLARQRPDLFLENYNVITYDAAFQFELEVRKGFHFLVGLGFEWRRVFGFEGTPDHALSPDVVLADRTRPFFRVTHESVVDPTVLRWDRRHTLESEFRLYVPAPPAPGFAWVELRYQFVKSIGWHELWVKARGHGSWGEVVFHDEVSVGEFVHGLFGNIFVPMAANAQLEFRFSITRDVVKVGLFNELAVFAVRPVRGEPTLLPQLADAFGPSIHFLAQDMFQVDMALAFGFKRLGVFGVAFSMQINKAF